MDWFDVPAPDPKAAAPAFADVDGARVWLSAQPQAMPARLQQAIAEQLERLASAPIPTFTRATLLECLRNATVTTHSALRRKFAFQPRPLAGEGLDAFRLSSRAWNALATGYLQCLEAFAEDPGARAAGDQRLAVAAHRALITCRQALEDHFVAGIEVPLALWRRLQRLIQVVSVLGVADVKVADPEYREGGETTPADQYALASMLALADPYCWTSAGFAVAHRAFSRWRSQTALAKNATEDPRLRWVPLSAIAELPASLGEASPEWLEVHQVRRKLRKRIQALDAGELPEDLQLGRDLNAAACRDLLASILDHLRIAYSEGREKLARVDTECELAVGPAGCFELLANKHFVVGQTLTTSSSRMLHDRIAIFGAAERVDAVDRTVRAEGERWRLNAESVDAAEISRPAGGSGARMLPGQLVVFRDARSAASLAIVTRAWTRHNGQSEIRLRRLPGKPEAMTAQAIDLPSQPAFPAFLLPAVPAVGSATSLLVPTGIAARLKNGLAAHGQTQLTCTLGKLLERGADFERYAFVAR